MHKSFKLLSFIITLSIFFFMLLSADVKKENDKYVEETVKAFKVDRGGTITTKVDDGYIRVDKSKDGNLNITVKKYADVSSESRAKDLFSDIEISFKQTGSDVLVEVEQDKKLFNIGNNAWSGVILSVPDNYNVDLTTGDGSIKVHNLIGNAKMKTGDGSISVGDVQGEVSAVTGDGSIKVGSVKKGKVELTTGDGSISIADIEKSIKVRTGDGSIKVMRVGGSAVVRTGDGSIRIGPLGGKIDATTGDGSISVDGSGGSVNITTGDGSVKIANARDTIHAKTGDGSITAAYLGREKGKGEVHLLTGDGTVTLSIPENLGADFDIEINLRNPDEDYKIISDFPLSPKETDDEITCTDSINGGGVKIKIRTTNSFVKIRKL